MLVSIGGRVAARATLLRAVAPIACRNHCQVPCGIFDDPQRVAALKEDAATIRNAIEQGDVDALETVASIVKRTGALDAAMRSAQSEIQRALDAAKHLPPGPYVDCMVQLAQQSLVRNS